jgi:hypothetical protein
MARLTQFQLEQFIDLGYIKIENAFSKELAKQCRDILWKATGADPDDSATWTKPVIRIGEISLPPFQQAANTRPLHNAFNDLAGDNWLPRMSIGSFPIRFPTKEPANDTGWHVDASFPGRNPDNYLEWRINIHSRGRALLMLFLFSDVEEADAPTIIKKGSHLDVARILAPEAESGLSFTELAQKLTTSTTENIALATGEAGTVYLCHPFLAHRAQDHQGKNPKFMAQPPLLTRRDFDPFKPYGDLCPIERAILKGISQ